MQQFEAREQQFIEDVAAKFNTQAVYIPASHHEPFVCGTSEEYTDQRSSEIGTLFQSHGLSKKDAPQAYLSEWTTYIGIAGPLEKAGLVAELAPAELEQGNVIRKGVDIVVSQPSPDGAVPMLGINVKLRGIKPRNRTERQVFDPLLCAPSVTLSLGDWNIKTREQPTHIRGWLTKHVIPNINGTGKIPYFYPLRQYMFGRIQETLESYAWKTREYAEGNYELNVNEANLLPKNPDDFASFWEKLTTATTLFGQVSEQI